MSEVKNKRIAIVVQRCSPSIVAGAEAYALQLGRALAEYAPVDILTSASDDYITWNNKLEKEIVETSYKFPLTIKPFEVIHSRFPFIFRIVKAISFFLNKISPTIYLLFSPMLDYIFLRAQGPWCPGLWKYLESHSRCYLGVIFKSYLYAPVALGLHKSKNDKNILVITAHDEPEFKLQFVKEEIEVANAIGYVSSAEKDLVETIYPHTRGKRSFLLPPGLTISGESIKPKFELPTKYFLVVGRVDWNKNVNFLFKNCPINCKVVFAGDLKIKFPQDERFLYVGVVSHEEKRFLIENSIALMMVSRFEAYSMITAESLALGKTVLALHGCPPVDSLIQEFGGLSLAKSDFVHAMQSLWDGHTHAQLQVPDMNKIVKARSWNETAKKVYEYMSDV